MLWLVAKTILTFRWMGLGLTEADCVWGKRVGEWGFEYRF